MKKILIVNNSFNCKYRYLTKFIKRFLNYYYNSKLRLLIKSLKKDYKNDLSLKVINIKNEVIETNRYLSDFRVNLSQNEYLEIKNKLIRTTRHNLLCLFKNSIELKILNFNGILIPKIIEMELILYLNSFFGKYELLNLMLQKERYDRVILINSHPILKDIFREFNNQYGNIEICIDKFFTKSYYIFKWLDIFIYILKLYSSFLKNRFVNIFKNRKASDNKNKENIVFLADTKNQFYSVKPLYDILEKYKEINLIFYSYKYLFPLHQFVDLLRLLFQKRRILIEHKNNLILNMEYDSIDLNNVLKHFYDTEFLFKLINIFGLRYNINKLFKLHPPSVVIIPKDIFLKARLTAGLSKINNIPTIYIPHSAQSFFEEMISVNIFKYTTVSGQHDKNYYINRGLKKDNVIITRRPRYDYVYKGRIKVMTEINDMFTSRKYLFDPSKFTILLTISPIGKKALQIFLSTVVNSLNKLDLLDNLIIKLHPREDGVLHKKILQGLNVNTIIVRDYNILKLIKSCDLILSSSPSTILEALIVGTPVLWLDLTNLDFVFTNKYTFMDEVILIKDQETLTEKIKELATNKDFLNKYSEDLKEFSREYHEEERSIEKLADLIINIIKNSNKNI